MKIDKIVSCESLSEKDEEEIIQNIEYNNFILNLEEYNSLEKDEKFLSVIDFWSGKINDELSNLFVDKEFYISPDEVFLLNDKELFNNDEFLGFFDFNYDGILINSKVDKIIQYKTLLHEMLHMASYRAMLMNFEQNKEKEEKNPIILNTRLGYDIGSGKLDWFNEAITEMITNEIIHSKESIDFLKNIKVDLNSMDSYISNSYEYEIKYAKKIIDKISDKLKLDKKSILNDLKRGYFNGNLMHLRNIEKVYGKNFLNFTASISFLFEKSGWTEKEVYEIFDILNVNEREEYIENIFKKKKKFKEKYKDYQIRLKTVLEKK